MPDFNGKGPRARSPRPSIRFGGLKRGIRKSPLKYTKKVDPSHRGKIIQNPDGSTSSERTITIGMDNKYYNIPSLVNGVQLSNDEATRRFRSGELKAVGVADTLEGAVKRAGARSKMLGRNKNPVPFSKKMRRGGR